MVDVPDSAWIPVPPFQFGEVYVLLTHDLMHMRVWGPVTDADPVRFEATPDELRQFVRTDERGRYRPLSGAKTMRAGWEATIATPDQDHQAVYDALYPLAMAQRGLGKAGLRVVSLDTVLARRERPDSGAPGLDAEGRRAAAAVLCGRCVKAPLWNGASWPDGPQLVCPEPCPTLVSLCEQAAGWHADTLDDVEADPDAPFADFESPANEVRQDYLRERYGGARSES